MTALLKDAIKPNIIQTLEHTPALVHGGPFANIAHGCNSVRATKMALKLSDITITEAGFGADLGAEKFYDIKCRKGGLQPKLTVLVATAQGLKMHGGVAPELIKEPNMEGLKEGIKNLDKHIETFSRSVRQLSLRSTAMPTIRMRNWISYAVIAKKSEWLCHQQRFHGRW